MLISHRVIGKMEESVQKKIDSYPENAKKALLKLRKRILNVAKECGAGPVSEELKWNEPSYITNNGSTIRIDWKPKYPAKLFLFFHCQTRLIETFKELYGDRFSFEGKRAIVFDINDDIPTQELEHCISLALRYHKLKHLPLLGA